MTSAARRDRILELVRSHGYMPIDDLVAHFQVTPQTLRGDLNRLAASAAANSSVWPSRRPWRAGCPTAARCS